MKHKTIHRALALLLAFALAAGLLSGLSFPAQAAGSRKSRTIMLYIVGTDLESVYGLATNNLKQILSVPYNDDINIVAYPLAAVPAPAEAEVWAEFAAVLRRYSRIHR